MVRWGMVVDLKRCIGCQSCTVACKTENATPPGMFFRLVLEKEVGTYPNARRAYLPTCCMHCGDPPCIQSCPSGAISKRSDGIVLIDQENCYGSKACLLACPYAQISFYDKEKSYFPSGLTPYEKMRYPSLQLGTSQKCNFCAGRLAIDEQPSCVQTCPTRAFVFGDLDDPQSEVSRLVREQNGYQLNPEYGTDPSVYYLPEDRGKQTDTKL